MMQCSVGGGRRINRSVRLVRGERAFTLIELLIVLVVLGIILVLAVPSYLGFRDRAADTTAKANIRAAVPAAEMFGFDNIGAKGDADGKKNTSGYKGMTTALLQLYDPGISDTLTVVRGKTKTNVYCLRADVGGRTWSALGPGITDQSFKTTRNCR